MVQRVLFLNRWPQFRSGPRWDNGLARPEDLFRSDTHAVTYLTSRVGQNGVPPRASDVHVVDDFSDTGEVLRLVDAIVAEHGPFQHVIAFSEYLLDLAALIREKQDVPGPRPDYVNRFRDKRVMKTVLAENGVRVPRWRPFTTVADALAWPGLRFPAIVKPARGASSVGVHKVSSADELRALGETADLDEHEIEEFVDGDVLHADGVVDAHGRPLFLCVSRYVSDCLAFEAGAPFGSVVQTDPEVVARGREFALRCLAALGLRSSAFHVEFFDTGAELVFLEVGARVPGADVPNVVHDVFGVNLFRLWTEVLLDGRTEPARVSTEHGGSGGWFMLPRPSPLPRTVVSATPLVGAVPFLYRELIPQPGDVLEKTPGYATLQGGRFLYRGGTQERILAAVNESLAQYRLTTTSEEQ